MKKKLIETITTTEGKMEKSIKPEWLEKADAINNILDECINSFGEEYSWGDARETFIDIEDSIMEPSENAIEIIKHIDKEKLQKIFKKFLDDGYMISEIESWSKTFNAPVPLTKGIDTVEKEAYIRLIHNSQAGHADMWREKLIEQAEEEGINLDYDKVVKMEIRDFLDIPKERWLDQKKEVEIDSKPVKVEIHGFFEEGKDEIKGKFIMSLDKETGEKKIIFDSTMGEHKDIGAKYEIEPIGGGWMTMNPKEKTIILSKESENFGKEPRSETIQVLKEIYPDWEIEEKIK